MPETTPGTTQSSAVATDWALDPADADPRASNWPAPCALTSTTRSTTPSGWPGPGTPGKTFRSRCAVGCADFEGTPARMAHW